jgi:heterodisulfide reductase subunit A
MEAGVRFVRYAPERPPAILENRDRAVSGVRVHHQLLGEQITINARTVVLTTPLAPHPEAEQLSRMLKVPLDGQGFFLEAHLKLRPVEFATDGVFIAGAARFPADIGEAMAQGMAAAAKAGAPMRAGEVSVEATTARTDPRICSGCGNCQAVCPFGAVQIEPDRHGRTVSSVTAVVCKGCGACVAACPCGAIQQQGFSDHQLFSMIESLAFDGEGPT